MERAHNLTVAELGQSRSSVIELRKADGYSEQPQSRAQTKALRIGVAGLGTVGGALLEALQGHPNYGSDRHAVVTCVSARSKSKARSVDLSQMQWFDDPVALAASDEIDVFVELIGGADGPAKVAVETALKRKCHVVTANKALIGEHGAELAALAEDNGAQLLFEGGVMGGTPAVKILRESFVAIKVNNIFGILNGTSNYILSEMERTGRPLADVLVEAQKLGYAEADPAADIGGFDAAHKLGILASLAFSFAPRFGAIKVEGIENVGSEDISVADSLGYRIRLLASAERVGEGVLAHVRPALVPKAHPLAQTKGASNALFIECEGMDPVFVQGPGAGARPTATAVAADLADVMLKVTRPVFRMPIHSLKPLEAVSSAHVRTRAYVRLLTKDKPGALAAITESLARYGVSIDSLHQNPVEDVDGVPITFTTHSVSETKLAKAVRALAGLSVVVGKPRMLRIAPFKAIDD